MIEYEGQKDNMVFFKTDNIDYLPVGADFYYDHTQSCSHVSHYRVILKKDEYLICERTKKGFLSALFSGSKIHRARFW